MNDSFNDEATRGIHEYNMVSALYFSQHNVNILQDAIRWLVYKNSCKKHIIDKQSETELKVIMRSFYLENPYRYDLSAQENVKKLNEMVLYYCVPRILTEIDQYIYFKQDRSHNAIPMLRAEFSSSKGTKILENNKYGSGSL